MKAFAATMLYSPRAYIDVKVDNRVQYQGVSTNVSHKKEQDEGGRKGVIDCGSNIIMQFIHLIKALLINCIAKQQLYYLMSLNETCSVNFHEVLFHFHHRFKILL